jgi:hypothetical protein
MKSARWPTYRKLFVRGRRAGEARDGWPNERQWQRCTLELPVALQPAMVSLLAFDD